MLGLKHSNSLSKMTGIRNSYVEVFNFKKFAQNTSQHCNTDFGKNTYVILFIVQFCEGKARTKTFIYSKTPLYRES